MANEEILQEDEEFLVLEDENGNEQRFDFLDCVEYEGKEYLAVTPYIEEEAEDSDEPIELVILEIEPVDEEYENYYSVTDEKIVSAVCAILNDRYKGKYTFTI